MSILDSYSGFDKAAVLMNIMGEPLALTLFSSISESNLLKLRIRSRELKNTPLDVKKSIMEEYYFKIMSEKYREHKEHDEVFGFLKKLNDEQIFFLLSEEEIKLSALVLEQLSTNKKMVFLKRLNPEKKNKIILEIGNLDDIPLEAVVSMAKELELKAAFIPGPKKFSRGGGKSIAMILNNMDEDESKKYIDQLRTEASELYTEVKKYYISFEDLVLNLPQAQMSEFWADPDIDIDQMALAIKGFESSNQDKLVDLLPGKKQAMYTPIEGPASKREVQLARNQILNIAKEKVNSEEWNLEDLFGGGETIE